MKMIKARISGVRVHSCMAPYHRYTSFVDTVSIYRLIIKFLSVRHDEIKLIYWFIKSPSYWIVQLSLNFVIHDEFRFDFLCTILSSTTWTLLRRQKCVPVFDPEKLHQFRSVGTRSEIRCFFIRIRFVQSLHLHPHILQST